MRDVEAIFLINIFFAAQTFWDQLGPLKFERNAETSTSYSFIFNENLA